MQCAEIREKFLKFFEEKKHQLVPSSPLIPQNDPTILFTVAGMVPFKDLFTGKERRSYTRATSSQKCLRAGGKHNDLENVGRTTRHHTFFEMLGNFSFGDYFKKEACEFAWEFLTQELKINPDKLSITVFGGQDNLPADTEAEQIWLDLGVSPDKITRLGAEDNFWTMGDTGPCGPCSEIHYDRALKYLDPGDNIMEVWNLVFMQYDRQADGTLKPLPAPSVDTGMGLERLATVLNNLDSNYDCDLLRPLIKSCEHKLNLKYNQSNSDQDISMRVIADHARATTFLISDGIYPGNEGRSYVLRRIMRRAIRHGAKIGFNKAFFHEICLKVINLYQEAYPDLLKAKALLEKLVLQEEKSFRRTLDRGLELFEKSSLNLKSGDTLPGHIIFKLYETYGFPADLTEVLAEERELKIDWDSFKKAKKQHEEISQGALGLKESVADIYKNLVSKYGPTTFIDQPELESQIIKVINDTQLEIILDSTNFYAESGGQVGDTGYLESNSFKAEVLDTQKKAGLYTHKIKLLSGDTHNLKSGDKIKAQINISRRERIKHHHSVTHLLHSALREKYGDHLTQKGSLVAPDKLRFDFSHFEPISKQELYEIESQVNLWILENQPKKSNLMTIEEAKKDGAMALFGEKYAEKVSVVDIGPHSKELCGGTHVSRTGDIGSFRITSEGPLAAGIRRIEAVAGMAAIEYAQQEHNLLEQTSKKLGVSTQEISNKINSLQEELNKTRKELSRFHSQASSKEAIKLAKDIKKINGINLIAKKLENLPESQLQNYADELRNQIKSGVIILGLKLNSNQCRLLVALTKDLTKKYHAGKLVGQLAQIIDGKGGGRPDFAQAGGTNPDKLEEALSKIEELL